MMRSAGYFAAAWLLLAACGWVAAEEAPPTGPVAWVEVLTSDPEAEALRPVVEEAARYRLTGLGLAPRLGGAPTWTSAGRTAASSTAVLEGAGRAGADFALECRYSGSGSRLSLQLNWYEVSTRLLTAAVDRRGRVDLVLDTLILDALDEVLERVRPRIEERVAEYRASHPVPAQPELTAGSPGPAVDGPASLPAAGLPGPGPDGASPASATQLPAAGTRPQGGAKPGLPPGTEPGSLPGEEPGPLPVPDSGPPAGRYPGARLLIASSLAPFVALGAASYYFPIGYQSMLQLDFLPKRAGARLGLGALLGVTVFQAEGPDDSGLGFLVPAGLSLRYSLELGRRAALVFQLGGGVAVLLMSTDSQGSLAKPLPFLRSGVGAELALGRSMSLGLEAAYEVYFERPYLIMGVTPGLCLSWRL